MEDKKTLSLEKFSPAKAEVLALIEKSTGLEIKGIDDKEGYAIVKDARKELKSKRVFITKFAKGLRADAIAIQKQVIVKENELVDMITPIEKDLEKMEKAIDQIKEMEKRRSLLPERHEKIKEFFLDSESRPVDAYLLQMDDNTFDNYYNQLVAEKAEHARRKLEADQKELDDEKERVAEAKRKLEEDQRIEEEKKQAKLDAEAEADAKAKKAKEDAEKDAADLKLKHRMQRFFDIGFIQSQMFVGYTFSDMDIKEDDFMLEDIQFEELFAKAQIYIKKTKEEIVEIEKQDAIKKADDDRKAKEAEDIRIAKEKQDKIDNDKAYQDFCASHGYNTETQGQFHVEVFGEPENKIVLYKIIGIFENNIK